MFLFSLLEVVSDNGSLAGFRLCPSFGFFVEAFKLRLSALWFTTAMGSYLLDPP